MSHAGPSVDKTTPAGPSNPAPAPQPPATLTDDNLQNLQQLVIDTASEDDQDSTFGDNYSSYSTSLASSIFNYEYSNGRRYHAYRSGSYLLPNDEQEVDRLDMLHHIFLLCLGGKLYEAPISEPTRILDVGTGSGIWAIVVAEDNPQAEVLGTDLSPIQPSLVTPNLKFYIDDAEAEWVYPPHEHFDFIHIRGMAGAIKDWDRLIQQAYDNMVPGGWLEFQEPESWCHSDDDTVHRAVYLDRWQRLCNEASDRFGKQLRVSHTLLDRIKAAGFVDCHEKIVKVPIGPWAKDPDMKMLGHWQREHMAVGIEPYTFGFIGKVLGWTPDECRVMTAKVVNEVRDRSLHLYVKFYFVYGRKPPG